jgi:hypothetical protein
MSKHLQKVLFGILYAILFCALIIYSIENHKSLPQILAGFFIFFIPFVFISSYNSRGGAFIFTFFLIMIGYIVSKYFYHDFWIGVLLAALSGGAIFYFRIRLASTFSTSSYIETAKSTRPKK